MTKKRTISIALAVIVFIIAAAVVSLSYRSDRTEATPLTFATSPQEVRVAVEGTDHGTVLSGQTIHATVGTPATVTVSHEGFVTYEEQIKVIHGQPNLVTVELKPETDEAAEILAQEQAAAEEYETTERYHQDAAQAYEDYPILNDLPEHGETYSAYQGLTPSENHDFGIHLHLYTGHEDNGREQFRQWLEDNNYVANEYHIIEQTHDEEPPVLLPEAPTEQELNDTNPEDITIPTDVRADGLDTDELALRFATVSTIWDTAEDSHHTEGLRRATALMTDDAQDQIVTLENPMVSPTWRDAANDNGRSVSWVTYYDKDDTGETAHIDMDICWAWVTQESHTYFEGPRTFQLEVENTDNGPSIDSFTYDDPDPFVDHSNTECQP